MTADQMVSFGPLLADKYCQLHKETATIYFIDKNLLSVTPCLPLAGVPCMGCPVGCTG